MKPVTKFFKTTLFILAINVTNALFGTTAVLESDENLENFISYCKTLLLYGKFTSSNLEV